MGCADVEVVMEVPMVCEVFFEINGSKEEQLQVALKIKNFLKLLQEKGDICKLELGSYV